MFGVIYQFKLKSGREEEFKESWAAVTKEFRDLHGGLGSCLHLTEDGVWLAYARWPDQATYEKEKDFKGQAELNRMRDCVEERLEPIVLDVQNDLLVHSKL